MRCFSTSERLLRASVEYVGAIFDVVALKC